MESGYKYNVSINSMNIACLRFPFTVKNYGSQVKNTNYNNNQYSFCDHYHIPIIYNIHFIYALLTPKKIIIIITLIVANIYAKLFVIFSCFGVCLTLYVEKGVAHMRMNGCKRLSN